MTGELPDEVDRAFEHHGSFERDDSGFLVRTTAFEGRVTAVDGPGSSFVYTVTVRVPTLDAATAGEVGNAVADGWFETLQRRLEDAPKATRADVELATFDVDASRRETESANREAADPPASDDTGVYVTYGFEWDDPDRAADIAKTFVEYVEGTYVEGIIPGYEYQSPVADLLESASQGDGGGGGTPL